MEIIYSNRLLMTILHVHKYNHCCNHRRLEDR